MDRDGKERVAMLSTRAWVLLLAIAFAALLAAAFAVGRNGGDRQIARIYIDGELYREIDISLAAEPMEFAIERDGMTNIVEVRKGGIRIADANCSDQTCVHQGWLEGGVTPIVCLPHRVVIRLETQPEELLLDAVAG